MDEDDWAVNLNFLGTGVTIHFDTTGGGALSGRTVVLSPESARDLGNALVDAYAAFEEKFDG